MSEARMKADEFGRPYMTWSDFMDMMVPPTVMYEEATVHLATCCDSNPLQKVELTRDEHGFVTQIWLIGQNEVANDGH